MIRILFLFILSCIFVIQDTNLGIATNKSPKIILITLDGVRWQDIFDKHEGVGNFRPSSKELIPNIYNHFIDNGIAFGEKSKVLIGGPAHVSLPGYLEIIRGYPSLDCLDNYCDHNYAPTIINDFAYHSAVFASWQTIYKTFDNSIAVVNIGKHVRNFPWYSLGLKDNKIILDDFNNDEYRPDVYTELAVLSYLDINQPKFMWISLGDTDEWAHQGNILLYWTSLNAIDNFIAKLMNYTDPNTIFILTTDHGRSKDFRNHFWEPESRRVWLLIGGKNVPALGSIASNKDLYLSDIKSIIMTLNN